MEARSLNRDDYLRALPPPVEQLAWYQRIWRAIKAIFCCCCYVPERDGGALLPGRASYLSADQGRRSPPPLGPYPFSGTPGSNRFVRGVPMAYPDADMPALEAISSATGQMHQFNGEVVFTVDDLNDLMEPPSGQQSPTRDMTALIDDVLGSNPDQVDPLGPSPAAAADRARVGGQSLEPAGADSLQPSVLIYEQHRPVGVIRWLNAGLEACSVREDSPVEREQALHRYRSIVTEVDMMLSEKQIFDPKQISTIPISGRDGRRIQNCVMSEAQELAFVGMHALRQFNDGLITTPDDREPIMAMYLLVVVSFRVAVWPLLHCLIADHKNGQAIDHRNDLIMGAASNYLTEHSTNNEMFLGKENDQIAQELLDNVVMPFFINAQGELHFLPAYTETTRL